MKRWLTLVGIASVLALGLGIAAPPQVARAITIDPAGPSPINILPSTIKGATGGGTAQQHLLYAMLYAAVTDKRFWDAQAKKSAGQTVTKTEADLIAAALKKFKIPAFKMETLAKVGGGALNSLFSFQIGGQIGAVGLEVFNVDADGLICSQQGLEWASVLTPGVDCDAWKLQASYTPNSDIIAGAGKTDVCVPDGRCWTLDHYAGKGTGSVSNSEFWYVTVRTTGAALPGPGNFEGLFVGTSGETWKTLNPNYGVTASGWPSECKSPANGGTNPATNGRDACASAGTSGGVAFAGPYQLRVSGSAGTGAVPVNQVTANPERTFKCVILGSNGTTYTASTAPFHETDAVIPEVKCPDLPAGVSATRITISMVTGTTVTPLYDQPTTPEYQTQKTAYPECQTGTCMLDLKKNGVSCFTSRDLCLDWYTDPDKGSKYSCWYGTHSVALGECGVYAPSFKNPGKLGNPDTGEEAGQPGTNPEKDGQTFSGPVQDPMSDRQCFPTGWGVLNPVEWVFRPVVCAFQWAFVPRPSVVQELNTSLVTAIDRTVLQDVDQLVVAYTAPFLLAQGNCQGPPFRIAIHLGGGVGMDETFHPLAACSGPMATVASYSYIVSGGIVYLGAGLALVKYFASIIGFVGPAARATERSSVRFKDEG